MSSKVLIVDDDEIVVFLNTETVLKSNLSINPLNFSNGEEALEYIRGHHKEEDSYIILLDINMPLMNGWEFLNIIQSMPFSQHVFVIMVTSSINNVDKERAMAYTQVIDYVEKPLTIDACNRIKKLPQVSNLLSFMLD